MAFKQGREYRSIDIDNFQTTDNNEYLVEGYATTFDDPYPMYEDYDGTVYYEAISSRALEGADMRDVIFLLNHDGIVMARIKNTSLALLPDSKGLYTRAILKGTEAGRQLYEAISNGLIDKMSWAFTVARDGWDYDRDTHTSIITKIQKVYDVSAVSIPANDGTEIKARSYLDGVIEKEQQELLLRQENYAMSIARLRLSRLETR